MHEETASCWEEGTDVWCPSVALKSALPIRPKQNSGSIGLLCPGSLHPFLHHGMSWTRDTPHGFILDLPYTSFPRFT